MYGETVSDATKMAEQIQNSGAIVFFNYECDNCKQVCSFYPEPYTYYEFGLCWQCGHKTKVVRLGITMGIKGFPKHDLRGIKPLLKAKQD